MIHDRHGLTPREQSLMRQLAEGKSNTVIAETLGSTKATITGRIRDLRVKLSLPDFRQLFLFAVRFYYPEDTTTLYTPPLGPLREDSVAPTSPQGLEFSDFKESAAYDAALGQNKNVQNLAWRRWVDAQKPASEAEAEAEADSTPAVFEFE